MPKLSKIPVNPKKIVQVEHNNKNFYKIGKSETWNSFSDKYKADDNSTIKYQVKEMEIMVLNEGKTLQI